MRQIEQLILQYCPNGVPWVKLGEVCRFRRGSTITEKSAIPGPIPVIGGGQKPSYYHNVSNRQGCVITIAGSGAYAGYVGYWNIPVWVSDAFTVEPDENLNLKYLYYFLIQNQQRIYDFQKGAGVPHVHGSDVATLSIPLPPLPVQEAIVEVLDTMTETIDTIDTLISLRKQQFEYYREKLLTFGEEVPWVKLGEVCSNFKTGKLNANAMCEDGMYPFFTCDKVPYKINTYAFDTEAILISGNGSQVGHLNYYKGKFNAYQRTYVLFGFTKCSIFYIYHLFKNNLKQYIIENCKSGSIPYITLPMLQNYSIPLPSLEMQQSIVEKLDIMEELIHTLEHLRALRQKQYEYYREKLLTFDK